jgi:hypothetical protein
VPRPESRAPDEEVPRGLDGHGEFMLSLGGSGGLALSLWRLCADEEDPGGLPPRLHSGLRPQQPAGERMGDTRDRCHSRASPRLALCVCGPSMTHATIPRGSEPASASSAASSPTRSPSLPRRRFAEPSRVFSSRLPWLSMQAARRWSVEIVWDVDCSGSVRWTKERAFLRAAWTMHETEASRCPDSIRHQLSGSACC